MELLKIFNENYEHIGEMTRHDVHFHEHWHESFQCIFTCGNNIILQKRSHFVADYKGLFDVTIGGHIKSNETIKDGIREIKEELGIDINFEDIKFLYIIPEVILNGNFKDKEFIHIYHYDVSPKVLNNISFDDNEVEDLVLISIHDFIKLCSKLTDKIDGILIKNKTQISISLSHFIPYSETYFRKLSSAMLKL